MEPLLASIKRFGVEIVTPAPVAMLPAESRSTELVAFIFALIMIGFSTRFLEPPVATEDKLTVFAFSTPATVKLPMGDTANWLPLEARSTTELVEDTFTLPAVLALSVVALVPILILPVTELKVSVGVETRKL